MSRNLAALIFPLLILGCRSAGPYERGDLSSTGSLETEFRARSSDSAQDLNFCADLEEVSTIEEIVLERNVCYGTCPAYTLILRADGSAEFHGRAYSRRQGSWYGAIDPAAFQYLARLADDIGFLDKLADHYSCAVTDNPTVFIAVGTGERRKIIRHYAPLHRTAPAGLDVFEDLVDQAGAGIQWHRSQRWPDRP